ncbi:MULTISPECIES: DVU_2496 family lipoprotein [unclassified Legionella]|uniref:DVU_2496 family lipoprotein n=1 Tax=unclassified Legionella TaxID=2622702 RepID=UPI001055D433|nr:MULTISPECIES: DVU_2496 family lipoprotein [unclassified Legionella]MDI9818798.1 hypothetical protein [Legionella sp. PL877]
MEKFNFFLFILNLIVSFNSIAGNCKHVYTLGAYDEAFSKHMTITKLGPIAAVNVPPMIPKSFLEKDGSYGGGEALCTVKQACRALKKQLVSGELPKNENWHIYLLDADWNRDTYKLHADDFRIKHPVKVLKLVRENC